jgi:hypothetical protein
MQNINNPIYIVTYEGRDIYLFASEGDTPDFIESLLKDIRFYVKKGKNLKGVEDEGEKINGAISRDEECRNILKSGLEITFSIKQK